MLRMVRHVMFDLKRHRTDAEDTGERDEGSVVMPAAARPTVQASGEVWCACGRRIFPYDEVVPSSGEARAFRRATDHVVCDGCQLSYPVREILAAIAAVADPHAT